VSPLDDRGEQGRSGAVGPAGTHASRYLHLLAWGSVSRFAEAIEAARRGMPAQEEPLDTDSLDGGPLVQLSVRVPQGLRSSVASTASARGLTVTAFVERALRREVAEANDSFVGLAAELTRNIRAELRSAVEDGAYRDAASEVEAEEAWS
jgi:hypothetical protein